MLSGYCIRSRDARRTPPKLVDREVLTGSGESLKTDADPKATSLMRAELAKP
jgi:hypothetical protein